MLVRLVVVVLGAVEDAGAVELEPVVVDVEEGASRVVVVVDGRPVVRGDEVGAPEEVVVVERRDGTDEGALVVVVRRG